jgi:hypothetical protein
MASASASAQITLVVKATLDGYDLPQISNAPNILTVNKFTVKLCQMAAVVESGNAGGKFGHMHVILKEKEYCIATKNNTATVSQLKKPPDVNPKFIIKEGRTHQVQGPIAGGQDKTEDHCISHPRENVKGNHALDGRKHRDRIH